MKKVLVISLGSIGKRHLRNARKLLRDAQIGVYRQHTRGDKTVPEGADFLFESLSAAVAFAPDAVIVASPASEHLRNTEPFLEAGAHVFLEKPLAANYDGVESFIKKADSSKSFVMVGYVLRFLPALHFIRDFIRKGELGEVRTAHAQVGQYLPDWRPTSDYRVGVSAQKALGGGALLELSHELDYSLWLFGKPDSIMCSRAKLSDLEIDVEDSAHVVFEYGKKKPEKRVLVQLDFLQRVANMALQIVGSKATLQADLVNETATLASPDFPKGKRLDCPKLADGNELYLRQFDFFFAKSFPDYKPQFAETKNFDQWASLEQGAEILRLVDLAKSADEQGRRLDFGRG